MNQRNKNNRLSAASVREWLEEVNITDLSHLKDISNELTSVSRAIFKFSSALVVY